MCNSKYDPRKCREVGSNYTDMKWEEKMNKKIMWVEDWWRWVFREAKEKKTQVEVDGQQQARFEREERLSGEEAQDRAALMWLIQNIDPT